MSIVCIYVLFILSFVFAVISNTIPIMPSWLALVGIAAMTVCTATMLLFAIKSKTIIITEREENTVHHLVKQDGFYLRQRGDKFQFCFYTGNGKTEVRKTDIYDSSVAYGYPLGLVFVSEIQIIKKDKFLFFYYKKRDTIYKYKFRVPDRNSVYLGFESN